jgi:predicted amidophosphoribosyltransferase
LKKNPSKRASNPPEYRYKVNAMRECAVLLGGAINHDWLRHGTLVPIPPSKVRDHPEFDNRIMWMCQNIPVDFPVDVREIVVQTQSTEKAHESDVRPTVADLLNIYTIDEAVVAPAPTQIAIVDDVLTVGTHFRAMHTKLSQRFPNVPIVGMFIARRIFANPFAGSDLAQF